DRIRRLLPDCLFLIFQHSRQRLEHVLLHRVELTQSFCRFPSHIDIVVFEVSRKRQDHIPANLGFQPRPGRGRRLLRRGIVAMERLHHDQHDLFLHRDDDAEGTEGCLSHAGIGVLQQALERLDCWRAEGAKRRNRFLSHLRRRVPQITDPFCERTSLIAGLFRSELFGIRPGKSCQHARDCPAPNASSHHGASSVRRTRWLPHCNALSRVAPPPAGGSATCAYKGESQAACLASRPLTMSKKAFCKSRVTGPGLPVPTVRSSTSRIGVNSAAVPVMNTSSAT